MGARSRHGEQRLAQEVVEDFQRQRVIAAVAELVHEHGVEPKGAEIVVAARISRSSLYRLFGSKRACVELACVMATQRLSEPLLEAASRLEPWPARLGAGFGGLLEAAADEPLLAELGLVHSPRLAGARVEAGPAAVSAALVELLRGGREAGRAGRGPGYREPAPGAEVFVAAGVIAMLEHCLRDGSLEASAARREELVELATEQLIGEERSATGETGVI